MGCSWVGDNGSGVQGKPLCVCGEVLMGQLGAECGLWDGKMPAHPPGVEWERGAVRDENGDGKRE